MALKPITNADFVEYLGLPNEVITDLKSTQPSVFAPARNRFLDALVNKIVYQTTDELTFTNPFKRFDGMPIAYGETIENTFVEVRQGHTYDPNATDPFARAMPEVKTTYATINYELQYDVTIYDSLLRRAVFNEGGLMDFTAKIIGSLTKAMDLDEYYGTIAMLDNANIYASGFEELAKGDTDTETAEKVTKTIANAVKSFALPLKTNNKLGVRTSTEKGNILLLIKKDLMTSIDFDFLAGVYNLSKIDLINNVIELDDTYVGVGEDSNTTYNLGFDFAIIDTKGFDNHIALQDNGMAYNPKGKYTNHFANLWKIVSFKPFCNARAWKLTEE